MSGNIDTGVSMLSNRTTIIEALSPSLFVVLQDVVFIRKFSLVVELMRRAVTSPTSTYR